MKTTVKIQITLLIT